jgi:uncharacterized protein YbjT (DUF2867 family)
MFVVAGVPGNTGKVVADTLLKEKQAVRVIVRNAEQGAPWRSKGAEVAIADLDDTAALTRALTGAKGVYLLLPPQMGSSDSRTANANRTAGYVKAIAASGVPHVVFLSSIGAHHASGTGPILSLHDAEAALAKVKVAVTIVRAAYFMENWGGSLYGLPKGELPTFLKADKVIPMVASFDIGTTLAKALLEGGNGTSIVELSGPRDYSPNDVAAALGRVTGKPVKAAEGPEEYMIPALTGAGMNAHWAGLYQELTHASNVGHLVFEGGKTRAQRGVTEVDVVLKKLTGG